MATCKECVFYGHCSGYLPSDLDEDIWHYCREGRTDEIPDIDRRCSDFKLDHYAQLEAAWDAFKSALWDEFESSKIGKFMIWLADKLEAWLEKFGK